MPSSATPNEAPSPAPSAPLRERTAILRLWLGGLLFFLGAFFGALAYLGGQRFIGTVLIFIAFSIVIYLIFHRSQRRTIPLKSVVPQASHPFDSEAVVMAFPEPIILLDSNFFVYVFNQAAQQLFPNIHAGKPLSFAVRVPEILSAIRQAAEGKSITADYSERIPKDTWMQVHAAPLMNKQKPDKQYILLSLKDLTPIRKAERMRVDFVANASHELRTPLASLVGFIETLRGAAKDDAIARDRFLSIMREQSHRMARLVNDLLSLSHLEQKAHHKPYGEVDLREIVMQVRDSLLPLAEKKQVTITLIMNKEPYPITADRDEMVRVVENLVENALKYGGDGEKIEIELVHTPIESPTKIRLSIRDYGAGIAAEHIPRLTERFYRADADALQKKQGAGLGLAIVKHILVRHQGKLIVESQPGKGSLFTVVLPAKKTHDE